MSTYYDIIPCCASYGPAVTFFKLPLGQVITTTTTGVYTGAPVVLNGVTFEPGQCYTIIPSGEVKLNPYPFSPPISDFTFVTDCTDEACLFKYYTLYSCSTSTIINTNSNLSLYANTFITLFGGQECFYVMPVDAGNCDPGDLIPVKIDPDFPCVCDCNCYQITGTPGSVFYIDCDLVPQYTTGAVKVCSVIPPVVTGGTGLVYNYGPCIDGLCPDTCYKFVNCQDGTTLIVSNTPAISAYYVDNKVVTLQGYEGCWSIELSDEPCDCAVNVTILQVYNDCPTCLPTIAYKFTNCNNQSIIKYSTDDYSAYVGKTVKLDCGDCWFVTLIDFIPPATQIINIITSFDSCLACGRVYYELVDCSGVASTIYTYTDLSAEVGKVIKLKDCETCWEVNLLDIPTFEQSSMATNVTVVVSYDTCIDCGIDLGCRCSIAWPDLNGELSYIDCNGQTVEYTRLDPNVQTEKLCVRQWIIAREPIYYGDCIVTTVVECDQYIITVPPIFEPQTLYYKDCAGIVQSLPCFVSKSPIQVIICGIANQTNSDIYITGNNPVTFEVGNPCGETPVFKCPPPVYPKRFIKPGYFTPHCDTEKYEKFACKSSEILYKTVLEKRYGISNCCPDTGLGEKWLVKKELADLQGARDQNYICTPVQTCCNNTPTCGCGCNVSSKTTCPTPPLPPPPPPPPVLKCVEYNFSIFAPLGAAIYYLDCNSEVAIMSIPAAKQTIILPVCGIEGQTATTIYAVGGLNFSFTETAVEC